MQPIARTDILGVILAGGRSRRMGGGDKFLLPLAGRPLIAHVAERLRPQVGATIVSANGDPARLAFLGLDIVPDDDGGDGGPLGGILAGLREAARRGFRAILAVPADTPLLPADLAARLSGEGTHAAIRIARSGGRNHPAIGLWPADLAGPLASHLAVAEDRSIIAFARGRGVATVEFATDGARDPFFNVNTPENLAEAGRLIGE